MRKILYTNGYGAGWTSWATNDELRRFMLEYRPIIEFIEGGGQFTDEDCFHRKMLEVAEPVWADDIHPIMGQFARECWDRFGEVPCLSGGPKLRVMEVSNPVWIEDHDGKETVKEAYDAI